MTEQQIRKVALFFFYAIGDNPLSTEFTENCLLQLQKLQKKDPDFEFDYHLVKECFAIWKKYKANKETYFKKAVSKYQTHPEKVEEAGVVKVEQLDLAAWHEFTNKSQDDEHLLVIWSKILLISDMQVARALGITEGTLRYRLGKALSVLGKALIPSQKSRGIYGAP